ncbi:MAG: hypothetical protein JSW07_10240 [bacterium]|nr:MAG: hypothetical protein JSW07_10240 [bacterium]
MFFKIKTSSRRFILVVFFAIAITVLAYGLHIASKGPVGIRANFVQVRHFNKKLSLIASFEKNKVFLLDIDGETKSCKEICESKGLGKKFDSHFGVSILVKPDSSGLYVTLDDELVEYDFSGNIIRKFSTNDFALGKGEYEFGEVASPLKDKVWLMANELSDYNPFFLAWDDKSPPKSRVIGPHAYFGYPDPSGKNLIFFGPRSGLFDAVNDIVTPKSWGEFSFCDFEVNGNQLLLSNRYSVSKYSKIVIQTADGIKTKKLTWGANAQYAPDGYIYFVRGTSHLLRVDPETMRIEIVYAASKTIKKPKWSISRRRLLASSPDRTYLAFRYRVPYSIRAGSRWGIVLLDLNNREYIDLSAKEFNQLYQQMLTQGSISSRFGVNEYLETGLWVTSWYDRSLWGRDFWCAEEIALFVKDGS